MTSKQTSQAQQSIYDIYAYFLTLILLISCACILQKTIPADIPATDSFKAIFLFPYHVLPETKERTIFLALMALLLPLNFIAIKLISLLKATQNNLLAGNLLQKTAVSAIPVLLMFVISWDELLTLMTGGIKTYWLAACFTFMLAMVVFLSALTLRPTSPQPKHKLNQWLKPGLVIVLSAAILISVLSYRIQSISLVDGNMKWSTSFEAVFYSISQVSAGKTLLADLPSQYGLYAEILKPFFSLVRLSVFSFTALMGALQIAGLLSLLWFCLRLINHNVLKLFSVLSLCLVIGHTWMVRTAALNVKHFGVDEIYQNWPIRFIFPALSLCVFYQFLRSGQSYKSISLIAWFAGFAITWNLDSGIAVFGSLMAYLTLQLVLPIHDTRIDQLKKTLLAIAIALIWIISFGIYLQLKAEQTIDWQSWLKYQQIFYKSGFGMLPMPTTLHPWIAIVSVYVFAITGALSKRMQKKDAPTWDMLFFIAILGLGIFPYYQGRSHILVLAGVLWPAMLIAFILADRTLRAIRARLLPFVFISTLLPAALCGVIFTAVFINGLPKLFAVADYNARLTLQAPKTAITENIAFIRHYTANSKKAVIISQLQAVYFGETGLASAINGPGNGETILVADREQFSKTLLSKPVAHLFIDQGVLSKEGVASIQEHYQIKALSPYGMMYLTAY